jgi:DNA-binding transcriptional regulator YhcF (GntR family)
MTARCLEIELKAFYNGSNNGDLFFSIRDAAKKLGVAHNTASKAFKELEEKGFIKARQKGAFQWKTRQATSWILTEYEYNGKVATKDFMRWRPEEKTRTQNLIPTVSEIDTAVQNLIPTLTLTASEIDTDEAINAPMTVANVDTQLVYHTRGEA